MSIQTADLAKLLENVPRGAWAAISHDETAVVAYSADLTEAVEKAKASGEERPIMIRVPECAAAMLL